MLHYLYIFAIILFSLRTDGCKTAATNHNKYSVSVLAAKSSFSKDIKANSYAIADTEQDILRQPIPANNLADNTQLQRLSASLAYWLHFGYYGAVDIPFYRKRQAAAWIPNACKTLLLFPMHHFL